MEGCDSKYSGGKLGQHSRKFELCKVSRRREDEEMRRKEDPQASILLGTVAGRCEAEQGLKGKRQTNRVNTEGCGNDLNFLRANP